MENNEAAVQVRGESWERTVRIKCKKWEITGDGGQPGMNGMNMWNRIM